MRENAAKKIAIYCRVSTDEQAKEGVSLDEQKARLHAYCRAMGWATEAVEYIDDGYSAKNMERPALERLLRHVKAGRVERLMVTKLDRLSRRLLDLLTLIELFQNHDVSFVSTSESFDTATPSGRLTLQVLGAVAEFERERIRERVFDNMLHAAKMGKWLTQAPYGYRLDAKKLVICEMEALLVQRVFRMFVEDGLGYFQIAKKLNQEHIPSRNGKAWSIRSVKIMLSNPAYAGTLVWNRVDSSQKRRVLKEEDAWVEMRDAHPAIVEQALWHQAQQRIASHPRMPPRAQASPHLLGGYLRCGECGAAMSIGWSGNPRRTRVYRCSAYRNQGLCQSKPYRADDVERWFVEALECVVEPVNHARHTALVQRVRAEQIAKLDQRMHAAKMRYDRQVEAYTAGLIEMDTLAREKVALKRCVAEYAKEMSTTDSSSHDKELEERLRGRAVTLGDALTVLPADWIKAKLRTWIHSVILHGREDLEIVLCPDLTMVSDAMDQSIGGFLEYGVE
ncbi:recombinase family protein [Ferroacidibacillus organovorans]|uniref:recombinase family protein n=1 Tax=Ferroacidibacillus organovorans TaxID=1765683 RepID=UPI00082F7F38|nr:recombinase family protein [Ferroacidibacillus organovorans]